MIHMAEILSAIRLSSALADDAAKALEAADIGDEDKAREGWDRATGSGGV